MAKKEFTATQVMALQEETLKQLKILAEQYGGIMDKLSEHDKRFDELEEKLTIRMDKGFTRLEVRIDGHDKRFDKLEGRFDKLEGRFDKLEIKVDKYCQKNETEHSDFQHRLQAAELK